MRTLLQTLWLKMGWVVLTIALLASCGQYDPIYTVYIGSVHRTGSYTVYDTNGEELATIEAYDKHIQVNSETDTLLIVDNSGRNHDRLNAIRDGEYYMIDDGLLIKR